MRKRAQVLVVVVIVVVAVGLLASASLRVRERANVARCRDNLKFLGMSFHFNEDTLHHFPPGTVPNNDLPPGKRFSWLIGMWFSIDGQVSLSVDKTKAWDAEENREPRGAGTEEPFRVLGDIKVFLCPGNPARGQPGWPGLTHYVGVAGLGKDAAKRKLGYPGVGVFGYDRKVTRDDLAGGQAQTILVIETSVDNGPWTAGGPPTVRGLDPNGPAYIGRGGQFGGSHRGGAVALFADGSTRFITESIDRRTLEGLVTLAGENFNDD